MQKTIELERTSKGKTIQKNIWERMINWKFCILRVLNSSQLWMHIRLIWIDHIYSHIFTYLF